MARWHGTSKRKPTGGRRVRHRGKRRRDIGSDPQPTTIGDEKRAKIRTRGGGSKTRAVQAEKANVTDPSSGDTSPSEIKTVLENPANPHYVRRNFITKGAIIETEAGRARVTSRPGQDGAINAVLID